MTRLALLALLLACCNSPQPERTPPLISAIAYPGMNRNVRAWTLDVWADGAAVLEVGRERHAFHVEPSAAERIVDGVSRAGLFGVSLTFGRLVTDGDDRCLLLRDGVGLATIQFANFPPYPEEEDWPQFRAALEAWCEVEALLPPIEPPPERSRLGLGHLTRVADEYHELARSR